MDLYEIVMKLNGPVTAVGDHGADEKRFANLKNLTELVDRLVSEITEAATTSYRQEASMKSIGKCAEEFLLGLRDQLPIRGGDEQANG